MDEFMNDDTIVKDEIHNAFKDSISCPLCLSILINPVMCIKCQNVYCKKCADDWSKKSEKCPNRCDNPDYQKSILTKNILSKLSFKCKKCGNSFLYENIEKHNKECNQDKIQIEDTKRKEERKEKEEKEENNKIEGNTNTPKISKFEKMSRGEIEKSLGVSLNWKRGDDIKSSKIFYQITGVSIENETDWHQIAKFHAEWSKKFYDVIVPYLR